MTLDEIDLSFATFWIPLLGLPMADMNKHNIRLIGASIDQLLDMVYKYGSYTNRHQQTLKIVLERVCEIYTSR